jgi:hypothetical protein
LLAHIITVTGWTPDYIEENLTLPRVYALMEYWTENPPMHLMVKAYLGIKGSGKTASINNDNAGDLLGMMGQAGVSMAGQNPLDLLMAPYLERGTDG